MLLSHDELMCLVEQGVITNVTPEQVNGSSIDVTLGDTIMEEFVERHSSYRAISIGSGEALSLVKRSIPVEGYALYPDEFVLAHTQQFFNMPENLSGQYHLKSSLGRIGLEHLNAGWIDPGWHNSCLTLELKNITTKHVLILKPGDRIGQITFHRHAEVPRSKSYRCRGRYNNSPSVSASKEIN